MPDFERYLTLTLLIFFFPYLSFGYTDTDRIKANPEYLFGEGYGTTLSVADDTALADLLSKISITVKSDFTSKEHDVIVNQTLTSETSYQNIIQTYSEATLTNTERVIVKPEPNAHVIRFIKKSEVSRIFDGRKNKVYEYVENGNVALSKAQIDDALKYYYWAYCLVKSLRYPNECKMRIDGQDRLLITWLPRHIEDIFGNISFETCNYAPDCYHLYATYQGEPIRSMDYSYFDGRDNSAIYSIRDGEGMIEMYSGLSASQVNLKVEYEFKGLAVTDREVENVMKSQEPALFSKAYFQVKFLRKGEYAAANNGTTGAPTLFGGTTPITDSPGSYTSVSRLKTIGSQAQSNAIEKIISGVKSGNANSLSSLFTPDGFKDFKSILAYGPIIMNETQNYTFYSDDDNKEIICRGVSCTFKFTAMRYFNEQLTFSFDSNDKISHVALGLGMKFADEEILMHEGWSPYARQRILSFLEDYRTAYATKDIDFMEHVFDDNALIIVGRKVQSAPQKTDGIYKSNQYVQLTKYSKDEFIKHLKASFAGKSYINLHFSNCEVVQLAKGIDRYGIQIKQDYYSSNYGDSGYLYLLVDLTDKQNPIIHVRTWQEKPDPNFGIIGPGHF